MGIAMKLLVIGLGSMGKRRVRNFTALGDNEVAGFDLREDRCLEAAEKYGITTFPDIVLPLLYRFVLPIYELFRFYLKYFS